ncbi:MAG: DUF2220 domain-containing protein [Flavobacteriales bacterium]|jgi:hypothetical protein|nr:DUF2220 domain-containing protein [Flavobacteriales bacterium]
MLSENLSWRELKALNDLYHKRFTRAKIQKHPYIKFLFEEKGVIDHKIANTKVLVPTSKFDSFYQERFKNNFQKYLDFFNQYSFLKPQSNYKERDIRVLMLIANQKEEILEQKYSRKKFSNHFFDEDAKYLVPDSSLEKAILQILDLEQFVGVDPKDLQYRTVLDCKNPKLIVLCENLDFLLYPDIAREHNIWLWYVGGNNIKKLDYLPSIDYPIYYSCDWDYHGLDIYQRIREKIPQIKLLYPSAIDKKKSVYSKNHKSDWYYNRSFSGLDKTYYSKSAIKLIEQLIIKKQWIEEESNDLIKMVTEGNDKY